MGRIYGTLPIVCGAVALFAAGTALALNPQPLPPGYKATVGTTNPTHKMTPATSPTNGMANGQHMDSHAPLTWPSSTGPRKLNPQPLPPG